MLGLSAASPGPAGTTPESTADHGSLPRKVGIAAALVGMAAFSYSVWPPKTTAEPVPEYPRNAIGVAYFPSFVAKDPTLSSLVVGLVNARSVTLEICRSSSGQVFRPPDDLRLNYLRALGELQVNVHLDQNNPDILKQLGVDELELQTLATRITLVKTALEQASPAFSDVGYSAKNRSNRQVVLDLNDAITELLRKISIERPHFELFG